MTDAPGTFTIRGVGVPQLGLGTWQLHGQECHEAVRHSLEIGYRHIDTARMYGNEDEVGRGIADSGLDRGEVFLVTKLWPNDLAPERVPVAAEASLRALGTEYVDLLLIHWPSPSVPLAATLHAMLALRDQGKAREIGVSNFGPELLRQALTLAPVFCDQVEYHPWLPQPELAAMAREHDLLLAAYSPNAEGRVPRDPVLTEIGHTYGKTPTQVVLRWLIDQPGVATIPRSSNATRRAANLDIFDFTLSEADRHRIDTLGA